MMFFLMKRLPPGSTRTATPFPYTPLFRSQHLPAEQQQAQELEVEHQRAGQHHADQQVAPEAGFRRRIAGPEERREEVAGGGAAEPQRRQRDRKSTRLNSSH